MIRTSSGQEVVATRAKKRLFAKVEGEGEALMMVHGLSRSHASWHRGGFISAFKENYTVITPDVLGHGKSSFCADPHRYHPAELAEDMLAILDELNLEKCHYLGYSLGGAIGLGLTTVAPERLTSLMIGGFSPDAKVDINEEVIDGLLQGFELALKEGNKAYVHHLSQIQQLSDDEVQWILGLDRRYFESYRATLLGMRSAEADALTPFNALSAPKLLYVGALDEYFPGLVAGDWGRFSINRHVYIDGATHSMSDEHRVLIPSIIGRFLTDENKLNAYGR